MISLPDRASGRRAAIVRERALPALPGAFDNQNSPNFVETLRKVWRHRRLVALCTVVFAVASVATVMSLPAHYVAEARILVGVPEPKVLNSASFLPDVSPDAEWVQSEGIVVKSRELAKQVVEQLHLANDPEFKPAPATNSLWQRVVAQIESRVPGLRSAPREASGSPQDADAAAAREENRLIDILLSKIDVTTLGRSHVLGIQADALRPDLAAAIANALARDYLAQERGNKVNATDKIEQYLTGRIDQLRQQVEKAEQAVADYRKKYGLYEVANTDVTSQQMAELNTQLILAQTSKAEADSRLRDAENLRRRGLEGDSVPEVLQSPLIQALKQQQAKAEQNLAELSATYGPRHPRIIDAKAQIADIRTKVQMEISRVIGGLRQEAQTADARYEALQQNFDKLKSQMSGVNDRSIHLDALRRDATVDRNLLEAMLARAKEAMGSAEVAQPDARLVSSAAPPERPAYPPKMLIVLLGTVGGVMIGVVLALLRDSVDQTFHRADQIENATGLPVLTMVPTLKGSTPPSVHVLRKPVSPYSEALRKLQIGIELSEASQSPRTILFCSATPAEGKSVMASSLGRLLASNGKRVMLIDCDWRRPTLHRVFRCSNKSGLVALLTDERVPLNDIIYNDPLSGLDVIPSGEWSPRSVHTLTSQRMRLILQSFAKNYDFVLLDTPPVFVGAEVLTLSRMVDKAVFVVRWGHTRRDAAIDALKQLVEAQADVAGVALSRVDPRRYRQYAYGNLNYQYSRSALGHFG
jgi:polysaccharide biosynthesis transport protein